MTRARHRCGEVNGQRVWLRILAAVEALFEAQLDCGATSVTHKLAEHLARSEAAS